MDKTLLQTAWDAVLSEDTVALTTRARVNLIQVLDGETFIDRPKKTYSNTIVRELLLYLSLTEIVQNKRASAMVALDLSVFINYKCPQWVDAFVNEFCVDNGDMEDVLDILYCAHHLRGSKPIPLLFKNVDVCRYFLMNAKTLDADVVNGPMLCEKYNLTTGYYDERPASCL